MFKKLQLSPNSVLTSISILALFISYELAFKKTINEWQIHQELQYQIGGSTLSSQPAYLARHNQSLSKIIQQFKTDTSNFKNKVAAEIAEISMQEKVKVVEVPLQVSKFSNQYLVQKLILKGSFTSLLKVDYLIEKDKNIGYLRCFVFKKNKTVNLAGDIHDKEIIQEVFLECMEQN